MTQCLSKNIIHAAVFLALLLLLALNKAAAKPSDLIGQIPAQWQLTHWLNSEPLTLAQLRGNVVLIRWWTAPNCPFCSASAVALNHWQQKYAAHNFTVIGIYHHKLRTPLKPEQVAHYAKQLGFSFPIAIDKDWQTLKHWWLTDKRPWTSVSLLLDRQGRIQHIHPGGQYQKGDSAYQAMEQAIQTLVKQPQ